MYFVPRLTPGAPWLLVAGAWPLRTPPTGSQLGLLFWTFRDSLVLTSQCDWLFVSAY
jgi:hypothetical protein